MGRDSIFELPGFRFHPTDEELVRFYLKRKVCGKSFPLFFNAISDVDIYKFEPWDLPGKSRLKSRDLEWYFFSALDKKYNNGSKTNRATERGYWKTTGKDREICNNSRTVGMKKTLVYHQGRAPRGARSNWVMHEYRIVDEQLNKAGVLQDAFVLCRIFRKSGSGPKNGEQYGAPFIEEEWEDDGPVDKAANEILACDDVYCEANDFNQNLDIVTSPENNPLPLNFYQNDNNNYVGDSGLFIGDDQKQVVAMGEKCGSSELPNNQRFYDSQAPQYQMNTKSGEGQHFGDDQKPVVVMGENCGSSELPNNQMFYGFHASQYELNTESGEGQHIGDDQKPVVAMGENCGSSEIPNNQMLYDFHAPQYELNTESGEGQHFVEASNPIHMDPNFYLNEPYFDAMENQLFEDGSFIEANDLKGPIETHSSSFDMAESFLNSFLNSDDDNSQYTLLDSSKINGMESPDPFQAPLEYVNGGNKQLNIANQHYFESDGNNGASSSKQNPEAAKFNSGFQYPFINRMLGNIPAPPAFASEFPTKDMAHRLTSQPSSPVHVTAGMIQIRDMSLSSNWSLNKNGNIDIIFSVSLPQQNMSLDTSSGSVSGKTLSTISRGWYCLMFFWVLMLSVSLKMGNFIYSQ